MSVQPQNGGYVAFIKRYNKTFEGVSRLEVMQMASRWVYGQ